MHDDELATDAGDKSNSAGWSSVMAWITLERCVYITPLGLPVVPLV